MQFLETSSSAACVSAGVARAARAVERRNERREVDAGVVFMMVAGAEMNAATSLMDESLEAKNEISVELKGLLHLIELHVLHRSVRAVDAAGAEDETGNALP